MTPNRLTQATAALCGQIGKLTVTALYFILAAQSLGPSLFGAWAAGLAITMILGPLSALGSINLIVKNGARQPTTIPTWTSTALNVSLMGAAVSSLLLLTFGDNLLPSTWTIQALVALCIAELFCTRVVDVISAANIATHKMATSAIVTVSYSLVKLMGAWVAQAISKTPTLENWLTWIAIFSSAHALALILCNRKKLRWSHISLSAYRHEAGPAANFSVSMLVTSAHNEIDKIIIPAYAPLATVGHYAAATRVTDMSYVPVRAMLLAASPHMFRTGNKSLAASTHQAGTLLRWGLAYALAGSVAIIVAAPAVPWILGAEYQNSVTFIRLLAPLLILRTLHYIAADTLTAIDRQSLRSISQILSLVFKLTLLLILLPGAGATGAVTAALLADTFLAAALWTTILYLQRRSTT